MNGEEGHLSFPLPSQEVQTAVERGRHQAARPEAAQPAGLAEAEEGRTAWRAPLFITFFTRLFTGSSRELLGAVPCSLLYLSNKHLFDPIHPHATTTGFTYFFLLPLSPFSPRIILMDLKKKNCGFSRVNKVVLCTWSLFSSLSR